MRPFQPRIIITGGPGSGKSTVLNILNQKGFTCSIEAGRAIIQDQVTIEGNALPWGDRQAFAELMLCWEMRSWHAVEGRQEPCFFDRGLPDIAGYLHLCHLPVAAHLEKAIRTFRYAAKVFIAPPWREIFVQDAERKQSFDDAEQTYHAMVAVYHQYGYHLLELPRTSAEARAAFIMANL